MRKLVILLIFMFSETATSGQYSGLIYQESGDIYSALRFIDAPDEKIEILRPLIKGKLADQALVNFSNKIIEARETKNIELFKGLTHQESLDYSKDMLRKIIEQIKDGSLIYGNNNYKYFVTSEPITERMLTRFFGKNVTKPSITLIFYHYHSSNGALIGSPMYLVKTEIGFRIVLPIRADKSRHNNAPESTQ